MSLVVEGWVAPPQSRSVANCTCSGQPLNWQTQRQETYSYDANLDYLIGANYGDGLPNQTPAWGYDAGGNRTSDSTIPGAWTYDSLNRIVSSPGKTYTHDVLGNRLTMNAGGSPVTGLTTHTWDILNRMLTHQKGSTGAVTSYTYRADGLRVLKSKHIGSGQLEQTPYRYDGQMGTEDLVTTGPVGAQVIESVTRYGLGARGIDVISRTTSSGTTLAYPIYDAHGNNVGLISRNGANYAVSQERSYDAWGAVRAGIKDTTKLTYCANLGHKEDDESGLIYMRARYYQPGSGRFISEDPAMDGGNWFAYCDNDPANFVDSAGTERQWFGVGASMGILFLLIAWSVTLTKPVLDPKSKLQAMGFVLGAIAAFTLALGETEGAPANAMRVKALITGGITPWLVTVKEWVEATVTNLSILNRLGSYSQIAGFAIVSYSVILMAAVLACYMDGNSNG